MPPVFVLMSHQVPAGFRILAGLLPTEAEKRAWLNGPRTIMQAPPREFHERSVALVGADLEASKTLTSGYMSIHALAFAELRHGFLFDISPHGNAARNRKALSHWGYPAFPDDVPQDPGNWTWGLIMRLVLVHVSRVQTGLNQLEEHRRDQLQWLHELNDETLGDHFEALLGCLWLADHPGVVASSGTSPPPWPREAVEEYKTCIEDCVFWMGLAWAVQEHCRPGVWPSSQDAADWFHSGPPLGPLCPEICRSNLFMWEHPPPTRPQWRPRDATNRMPYTPPTRPPSSSTSSAGPRASRQYSFLESLD